MSRPIGNKMTIREQTQPKIFEFENQMTTTAQIISAHIIWNLNARAMINIAALFQIIKSRMKVHPMNYTHDY